MKDALNQEYIFTYDPLGRVLTQTRAGSTMSFEYDAVSNRTKRTDYLGRVTDYQYDNLNRLTNILYASTVDATYTVASVKTTNPGLADIEGDVGFGGIKRPEFASLDALSLKIRILGTY